MEDNATAQMTSSEFISFVTHVSRRVGSWDEATTAFPGPPRWEGTKESETSGVRIPTTTNTARSPESA